MSRTYVIRAVHAFFSPATTRTTGRCVVLLCLQAAAPRAASAAQITQIWHSACRAVGYASGAMSGSTPWTLRTRRLSMPSASKRTRRATTTTKGSIIAGCAGCAFAVAFASLDASAFAAVWSCWHSWPAAAL
eukprot:5348277-Prymnesium_polylepis.1